ncbi:hypothetical protein BV22DRAFT_341810 [Leucogyrophana mollusca]|uniref:Uncharacterized protein n=1 Tax=Leucogyrophana mollusca TaxID=85980 RepID=A0ACB8BN51_9AGAM|nr:hypothetical protein BV22DRAFT_341810 [Leucogyrophana mollusca]
MKEAPRHLNRLGWKGVRRPLDITIRCWTLQGFLAFTAPRNAEEGLILLRAVLKLLLWGRKTWQSVPVKDKGVVFGDWCLKGIQRLFMIALRKAYLEEETSDVKKEAYISELGEFAEALVVEQTAGGPPLVNPADANALAWSNSFWHYPMAEGLSYMCSTPSHAFRPKKQNDTEGCGMPALWGSGKTLQSSCERVSWR